MTEHKKIHFILPEDISMAEIINDILKNNGLNESDEELFSKLRQSREPRFIIVRDAALTIAEKKIPEKKLIELLEKHLEISSEIAQRIIYDISQKLIPYAKVIELKGRTEGKEKGEGLKKELLQKIHQHKIARALEEKKPKMPYLKGVEIPDVEKNAENISQLHHRRPSTPVAPSSHNNVKTESEQKEQDDIIEKGMLKLSEEKSTPSAPNALPNDVDIKPFDTAQEENKKPEVPVLNTSPTPQTNSIPDGENSDMDKKEIKPDTYREPIDSSP